MIRHRSINRLTIIAVLMLCAASNVACKPDAPASDDNIRMALSREMSGYFVVAGENYGFPIDLVDSFALAENRKLIVDGYMSLDEIEQAFEQGECQVATVLSSNVEKMRPRRPSEKIYSTSYVLISRQGRRFDPTLTPAEIIGRSRLLVDAGFNRIESYRNEIETLCDSLVTVSPVSGFEKAQMLQRGECDWFICEKSEAQIICYMNRNLEEYYEFTQTTDVSLVFDSRTTRDNFRGWFAEFKQSDAYGDLEEFYFGEERVSKRYAALRHRPTRVVGGISVWDERIRRIASRDSVDWRLLSAIAYNESRFRGDLVSRRGAVGLMQIMPIVALEFHLDTAQVDLADPEVNITLASKLIRKTMRTLNFPDSTDAYDRSAITVAVYHCGIGRVGEARRVISSSGGDPNSWNDVRETLLNMGSADFVAANGIKGGTFRDRRMTVAYVKGVMDKYESYCEAVK